MYVNNYEFSSTYIRGFLLLIFVFSLIIRIVGISVESYIPQGGHVTERYTNIAEHLIAGRGFITNEGMPNIYEPPLYPYILAGVFSLFGHNLELVKILQAAIDSFTVIMIFLISTIVFNLYTAYIASIFYCFYPLSVYCVADIAPETTFSMLLTAAMLYLILGVHCDKRIYFALSGLFFGLSTLTRTTTIMFIPFLIVLILLLKVLRTNINIRINPMVLCLFVFLGTIAPWTIRNYIVSRNFVPVAVNSYGDAFLQGSNEKFFLINDKEKNLPLYLNELEGRGIKKPSIPGPKAYNDYAFRAGLERYKDKWMDEGILGLIKIFISKFLKLWYLTESGSNHSKIIFVNLLIIPLAVCGLIKSLKLRRPINIQFPVFALVAYFIVIHIITLPLHRYVVPIVQFIIMYQAFFLSWIVQWYWENYHLDLKINFRKAIQGWYHGFQVF